MMHTNTKPLDTFVDKLQCSDKLCCWLWARKPGLDPQQPTDRFDSDFSLSFAEYEKIRFTSAVVFRGQKIDG